MSKTSLSNLPLGTRAVNLQQEIVMCLTLSPARITQQRIYSGESTKLGEHILIYGNLPLNVPLVGGGGTTRQQANFAGVVRGGNAVIIPLPAQHGSLTPDTVIDPSCCGGLLDEMTGALSPQQEPFRLSSTMEPRTYILEKKMYYHIILVPNSSTVLKCFGDLVTSIPPHKRPKPNRDLFEFLADLYPEMGVALCLFSNTNPGKALPLFFRFKPANPEVLFFPALDGHTGSLSTTGTVNTDQWLVASSDLFARDVGVPVRYPAAASAAVISLRPKRVIGKYINGRMPNGDFVLPVEKLRRGEFAPELVRPRELSLIYH